MDKTYSELEDLAVRLFGKNNVTWEGHEDTGSLELDIIVSEKRPVKRVGIYLYPATLSQSFMLIDDFRFEYEKPTDAIAEVETYLRAITENKVYIKSWNIFGMKFNKRLLVK